MGRDQFADQRHHAGNDLLLAVAAIGEEGVVGDIDIMRIGPATHDLTQHREAAEAGIEDKDRSGMGHAAVLADPRLPFSCFLTAMGPARSMAEGPHTQF